MAGNRFVGHSKELSVSGALADAVAQATKAQSGVADAMIEFEVVNVRGRVGGIAGFNDIWVEISVGRDEAEKSDDEEEAGTVTTMAVGEEGGEIAADAPSELAGGYTTLAIGEEGGDGDKVESAV